MADSNQNSPAATPPSFEQALSQLEQIVHDLEEGRLGLADSLARYEDGVKLLKQCYTLLEQAEHRIELLSGVDASGNPITQPFDHQATLATGETSVPQSRRGGKSKKKPAELPESSDTPPSAAMDEPGGLF